jgi:hypothetical protein
MSFTIPESFVQQYGNNFRVLYQQKQARLRPWCQIESGIVGQSKSVERMGKAEAYDITSRHSRHQFVEVPHSRRWIDLQDKGWAELIDKLDKVRLLADPTNGYAMLANARAQSPAWTTSSSPRPAATPARTPASRCCRPRRRSPSAARR